MTFYSVVWIFSKMIVYQGDSQLAAAEALVPGTCWGEGPNQAAADRVARGMADRFQQSGAHQRLHDASRRFTRAAG